MSVPDPQAGATDAAPRPARGGALHLVATVPFYRGATAALLLSGLGFSAAAPQIATFLVRELDASLATAGLYYLTNLTAPVAGYLIGARSDRTGNRLGLFRLCALIGALGWAGIALSTQLWMPFVLSALALAVAGAATSQLFAALHDELTARPAPGNDGVVAIVRMALTAGWVVGPVLGTLLAAQAGSRAMLLATAAATLLQIAPLGLRRDSAAARRVAAEEATELHAAHTPRPGLAAMAPLLLFTGLYVCVYAGESVKYAYLPLHMSGTLHLPAAVSGAIIGVQPLVELALMPLAVIAGRRLGMLRLMVVGAGFGVGANLLFALSPGAAGLFAGQVLMGGVWGIFAVLGIIVAQRLLPGAVATASAIFLSSTAVSSALGGALGGIGTGVLGLPHVFLVPGALGLVAMVGLVLLDRRLRSGAGVVGGVGPVAL